MFCVLREALLLFVFFAGGNLCYGTFVLLLVCVVLRGWWFAWAIDCVWVLECWFWGLICCCHVWCFPYRHVSVGVFSCVCVGGGACLACLDLHIMLPVGVLLLDVFLFWLSAASVVCGRLVFCLHDSYGFYCTLVLGGCNYSG